MKKIFHKIILIIVGVFFTQFVFAQTITTVAGNGIQGFSGDGGIATLAEFSHPMDIAFDAAGNCYIADYLNNRIRKVSTSGIISTVAGNGSAGFSGDGGIATSAALNIPSGVAVDGIGNIYIADRFNNRIRMINTLGIITTVAGNGSGTDSGDGGMAISAGIYDPKDLVLDGAGNIYVAQMGGSRVRKINSSNIISTIAGNGTFGFSGDGGLATAAVLYEAAGVALDAIGNIYIADKYNNRIRKVNISGVISTIIGNGTAGYSGDGGPAINAQIYDPWGVVLDGAGNIFIADNANYRIRKVNSIGTISTVVGTGTMGFSGDGGPAINAQIDNPNGQVAIDPSGNLYFTDGFNNRIRMVTLATGIEQFAAKHSAYSIFPIPNCGTFNLKTENEFQNGELLLFNSLGQKVHQHPITQGSNQIITSTLSQGIYHYSILQDKQVIGTGKIVIE